MPKQRKPGKFWPTLRVGQKAAEKVGKVWGLTSFMREAWSSVKRMTTYGFFDP